MRLPLHPDDLDPRTLTHLLRDHHPNVEVAAVAVRGVHEVTNTHVRLRVDYTTPTTLPRDLFVKMVPTEPSRRAVIARTDMGRREVRFYTELAPRLTLRVPAVYAARFDPADGSFVLVMEDLLESGCSISDGTRGVAPDAAARALAELADLHVRFEDPDRRAAEAPWVPEPTRGSTYGVDLLRQALAQHRDRLSHAFAAIAAIYVERSDDLQACWHDGPRAVIHGDPHIGNLFDDRGRTGFLDWGVMHVGSPLRDVSYFLTMAMDPADRRDHERDLLAHYLAERDALGGVAIGFDTAWASHRRHAAYTVVACCQIVTFPDDISHQRRVFSDAFLARAEAAVHDLDALAALRTAGF